jgi:hypothetical protein
VAQALSDDSTGDSSPVDALLAGGQSKAPADSTGGRTVLATAARHHQDLDDDFALAWK